MFEQKVYLKLQDGEVWLDRPRLPALALQEYAQLVKALIVVVAEVTTALLLDRILQVLRLAATELLPHLHESMHYTQHLQKLIELVVGKV